MMEKIESKLAGWKAKLLSQSARLTLLKSVLQSIPVYQLAVAPMPLKYANRIDAENILFLKGMMFLHRMNFIWRVVNDALPNLVNLKRHHMNVEDTCMLCNQYPETLEHVFLLCPFARAVWFASMLNLRTDVYNGVSMKIVFYCGYGRHNRMIQIPFRIFIFNSSVFTPFGIQEINSIWKENMDLLWQHHNMLMFYGSKVNRLLEDTASTTNQFSELKSIALLHNNANQEFNFFLLIVVRAILNGGRTTTKKHTEFPHHPTPVCLTKLVPARSDPKASVVKGGALQKRVRSFWLFRPNAIRQAITFPVDVSEVDVSEFIGQVPALKNQRSQKLALQAIWRPRIIPHNSAEIAFPAPKKKETKKPFSSFHIVLLDIRTHSIKYLEAEEIRREETHGRRRSSRSRIDLHRDVQVCDRVPGESGTNQARKIGFHNQCGLQISHEPSGSADVFRELHMVGDVCGRDEETAGGRRRVCERGEGDNRVVEEVQGRRCGDYGGEDGFGNDFGWGKPKKVDVVSIDKSGAFSLAESKKEKGGVEIGIVLEPPVIEAFALLYVKGI
ncbi:phenolic glucoside malonyltransferase 2-like [Senna tora]|uniref:Phenolic glucoside malonyltransferase 2-like n=1 Tax=Senna tora TaxID=362788 RepID=A0A834T2N6_9FABA|nr:phenolic glucoside malonyltransferase 2-like [Senna tora]